MSKRKTPKSEKSAAYELCEKFRAMAKQAGAAVVICIEIPGESASNALFMTGTYGQQACLIEELRCDFMFRRLALPPYNMEKRGKR